LTCYVNWFWVAFVEHGHDPGEELSTRPQLPGNGAGLFTHIKVDDVGEAYRSVLAAGMKPDGEPEKSPSGNREFILCDPDGYTLAFFGKRYPRAWRAPGFRRYAARPSQAGRNRQYHIREHRHNPRSIAIQALGPQAHGGGLGGPAGGGTPGCRAAGPVIRRAERWWVWMWRPRSAGRGAANWVTGRACWRG